MRVIFLDNSAFNWVFLVEELPKEDKMAVLSLIKSLPLSPISGSSGNPSSFSFLLSSLVILVISGTTLARASLIVGADFLLMAPMKDLALLSFSACDNSASICLESNFGSFTT